jgi:hypothetical protein
MMRVCSFLQCSLFAFVLAAGAPVVAGFDFNLSGSSSFNPSGSFGTDGIENASSTRVDASFIPEGFSGVSFSLTQPGNEFSFKVGTIQLNESEIVNGEVLGSYSLAVEFSLLGIDDPALQVTAGNICLTQGIVGNPGCMLSVTFIPIVKSFASGAGLLLLELGASPFTGPMDGTLAPVIIKGAPQDVYARATMLLAPSVPEPASLIMAAVGIAGGLAARRVGRKRGRRV